VISDDLHIADALDLQILRALQIDGRVGFGALGRVLGVSDQTVARRYARMRSASGLRVTAAGDARPPGHRQWYVRVRTTPDAAMVIARAIARHPDTAWVRLVSGGTEIVCSLDASGAAGGHALLLEKLPRTSRVLDVTAQSELHVHARGAHRLLEQVGCLDERQLRGLQQNLPAPNTGVADAERGRTMHLNKLDLVLLTVLRKDARTPVEQLAAAAGTPASTARRRLARLRTSGALRIDVDLDARALGLHEQTLLWISVAPADLAATGAALATHPEVTFAAATTGRTSLYASVMTPDATTPTSVPRRSPSGRHGTGRLGRAETSSSSRSAREPCSDRFSGPSTPRPSTSSLGSWTVPSPLWCASAGRW